MIEIESHGTENPGKYELSLNFSKGVTWYGEDTAGGSRLKFDSKSSGVSSSHDIAGIKMKKYKGDKLADVFQELANYCQSL